MLRREQSMVISKIIRPNKKTLINTVVVSSRCKRLSMHDRIINVLKKNKKGLTHSQILEEFQVKNSGSIHTNLQFMIKTKEINRIRCPHCSSSILYKIII
jgi:hypothetical protein